MIMRFWSEISRMFSCIFLGSIILSLKNVYSISAKYLVTGNFIYLVLYPRRRISIQESEPVNGLGVIHNKSLFVIFRDYYKFLGAPWRLRRLCNAFLKHPGDLRLNELSVRYAMSPGSDCYWVTVRGLVRK